jgi:hypothetical protein
MDLERVHGIGSVPVTVLRFNEAPYVISRSNSSIRALLWFDMGWEAYFNHGGVAAFGYRFIG